MAATAAAAVLTVPLVFAVAPVLPWLFGDRYEGAVPAAQVLVAFTPAIVALYLAWYALVAERRERVVLIAAAVAVLIALAGAVVVLERPEPAVTAVATCVQLTVAALALCAALWRRPRGGRG
jgi:O-antigen/teichoic acid export membrane protein